LPSQTLSIRCDGEEILSVDVSSQGSFSLMMYFPASADTVQVYSGDILVATAALRGVKDMDNFIMIEPIPDPSIYQPGK